MGSRSEQPAIGDLKSLEDLLRKELGGVEGIEGVLIGKPSGEALRVFAVVKEHSRALTKRIDEAESRILDQLAFRVDIGIRAHQGKVSAESLAAGCTFLSF